MKSSILLRLVTALRIALKHPGRTLTAAARAVLETAIAAFLASAAIMIPAVGLCAAIFILIPGRQPGWESVCQSAFLILFLFLAILELGGSFWHWCRRLWREAEDRLCKRRGEIEL